MGNFSDPYTRKDDYYKIFGYKYPNDMSPQNLAIQEEMQRLQDSYVAKMYDDFLTYPQTASENKSKSTQAQNLILLLCN